MRLSAQRRLQRRGAGRRGLLPDHHAQRRARLDRGGLSQAGAVARQPARRRRTRSPRASCSTAAAPPASNISSAAKRAPRHANVEVIVASGAFNSPQLLQLSGLGPAELLRSLGIPVIADLPGVGNDLNDHYFARIILRCREPITLNDAARSWLRGRQGGLRTTRCSAAAISRSPAISAGCFCKRASGVGDARHPVLDRALFDRTISATGSIRSPASPSPRRCCGRRAVATSASSPPIRARRRRSIRTISPPRRTATPLLAGVKALRRMAKAPALARHIVEEVDPGPAARATTR